MTTVVWDGVELVADRKSTIGGTPMAMRKVYKVTAPNGRRALLGCCGVATVLSAYRHWLSGGEKPDFTIKPDLGWTLVMVDDRHIVYFRSNDCDAWERLGKIKWAVGSGADYALGAMAAGKTGREALRIAAKLDNQTGMGMNAVRFETTRRG